jgi:hypothetical protein
MLEAKVATLLGAKTAPPLVETYETYKKKNDPPVSSNMVGFFCEIPKVS